MWSCPVECRNRGPNPTVVASFSRSRRRIRTARSARWFSSLRGRYAWMARYSPGRADASSSRRSPGSGSGISPDCRIFFVASFADCTSGWSNGWMPMTAPATAVANSHRNMSPPSPASSSTATGCPAARSSSRSRPTVANSRSSP